MALRRSAACQEVNGAPAPSCVTEDDRYNRRNEIVRYKRARILDRIFCRYTGDTGETDYDGCDGGGRY